MQRDRHTMIAAEGLGKIYREGTTELRALQGVDLEVRAGELTLLMGPSGSGKTTLLSILGCILQASGGKLEILGEDVGALSESELSRIRRTRIGFVFQGFNLFPTLTAAQNVALALDLKGVPRREARGRAVELLERVGLGAKTDEYPADLSGGQKQRVAIARAIAGDPPIVLADEPTAALDTHSGHAVMELLQRLAHDRSRAVVVVTHDNRMLGYADRTVQIEDGRIVSDTKGGERLRVIARGPGVPGAQGAGVWAEPDVKGAVS